MEQNIKSISLQSLIMCGLAALCYFYQYIVRVIPGQCIDAIQCCAGVDPTFAGTFSSIYLISISIAQIPFAIMANAYGPRKTLLFGLITLACGNILQHLAQCHTSILVARAIVGFASASGLICGLQLINRWLHPSYTGRAFTMVITFGILGTIITNIIVSQLLAYGISWKELSMIIILLGIAITTLCVILLDDNGPYVINTKLNPNSKQNTSTFGAFNMSTIINCTYAWFAYTPFIIGDFWAPQITSHLGINGSLSLQNAILLGVTIGLILFGYCADKFGCKNIMIFGGVANALLFISTYFTPISLYPILFLFIGIIAATSTLPMILSSLISPKEYSDIVPGITNFAQMIGGTITSWCIGMYLASYTLPSGTSIYPHVAYTNIFIMSAIAILFSTSLIYFIKLHNESK